jgi:hypothetical protein
MEYTLLREHVLFFVQFCQGQYVYPSTAKNTRISQDDDHVDLYKDIRIFSNTTGNVRINVTLRRLRLTIVAVEKQ